LTRLPRLRANPSDPPGGPVAPDALRADLEAARKQLAWLQSRAVAALSDIREAEFQVYSQFGEDGIIQFLIHHVPIENDIFVEFGVQDYSEANTRLLLAQDNWAGLIIDAGDDHRRFLRAENLDWRHQIDAVSAFIDRDNINELIRNGGVSGDIGLLSVDLDGNDYWVLEAIDVVSPRILVAEYNSLFGSEAAVTIPYDEAFTRSVAHPSWLYWGASLTALTDLAERKGFALVTANKAGNNAFFVRRDVLGELREMSVEEAYEPSRFRESRDADGSLSLVSSHEDRLALIADMPLWDTRAEREVTVAERLGP
jgi:hypothetical protein